MLSASAAKRADGSIIVSLANVDVENEQTVEINIEGASQKNVEGRILTCDAITDYNDFDHPNNIAPAAFKGMKLKKDKLTVKIPAKSIVVINLKG